MSIYAAYLVENGSQSSTIRSYTSAVKFILKTDGYQWDDDKLLLNAVTKVCRVVNDKIKTHLPIGKSLMEIILFEVERFYANQPYLEVLFKTFFILSYYGLFRVGELATGTHPAKACNVHMARNRDKILIILYSSKTHGDESRPQEIEISAVEGREITHFCPFNLARQYMRMRGGYVDDQEPFFIYRDRRPVTPSQVRTLLRRILKILNLNPVLYDTHSWRIGHASDLFKSNNCSVSFIRQKGHWKSNTVFKYLRNLS